MDNKKPVKWLIPGVIFAVIAVAGFAIYLVNMAIEFNARKKLDDLGEFVITEPETETVEEPVLEEPEEITEEPAEDEMSLKEMLELEEEEPDPLEGMDIPVKVIDWDALHSENEDIYAWITVTGTNVDYPILQHPTDPNYYLDHNIDGSRGYPGCIYTENYNSKEFDDPNTVVYGHNMADGSMFSSLHRFKKPEMWEEEQFIYVYTEDYIYVYRIFGAYEFSSIHLLLGYDLSNEYVFEQYLKDISEVSTENSRVAFFVDGYELSKDDRLITLSTCTPDSRDDLRFLVQGVLLGKKQVQDAGEE